MRLTERSFTTMALGYLILPVLIFFWGFLRIPVALVLTAALLFCALLVIKRTSPSEKNDAGAITITIKELAVMVIVFGLWAYLSGVGGHIWQTEDYAVRNAVMNDLTNRSWPLFYENGLNGTAAFSYYFTYWLPSAIVGKIFGIAFGRAFLFIWTLFGLLLIGFGIKLLNRDFSWLSYLILIFFGGLDIVFISRNTYFLELENWDGIIKYLSNANQLGNIFNQCVPFWLITVMLMLNSNSESIGLIGSLTLCYSPWATIGMLPIAICRLFQMGKKLRNFFSLDNIIAPLTIFVGYGFMYMANSSSTSLKGFLWVFYNSLPAMLIAWGLLFAVEVLPYFLFLFKDEKKNPLFLVVIVILILTPLYRITLWNDFCMRVSAPALFVLCLMTMKRVENIRNKKLAIKPFSRLISIVTGLMILLGSATFFVAIIINSFVGVTSYSNDIESFGNIKNSLYTSLVERQFFVYDYEDTFYYKYLSK